MQSLGRVCIPGVNLILISGPSRGSEQPCNPVYRLYLINTRLLVQSPCAEVPGRARTRRQRDRGEPRGYAPWGGGSAEKLSGVALVHSVWGPVPVFENSTL
jgi:hypothetical protein